MLTASSDCCTGWVTHTGVSIKHLPVIRWEGICRSGSQHTWDGRSCQRGATPQPQQHATFASALSQQPVKQLFSNMWEIQHPRASKPVKGMIAKKANARSKSPPLTAACRALKLS